MIRHRQNLFIGRTKALERMDSISARRQRVVNDMSGELDVVLQSKTHYSFLVRCANVLSAARIMLNHSNYYQRPKSDSDSRRDN